MRCLECGAEPERLSTEHLLACAGLTLQEYALRRHLPLDLLLSPDQINRPIERAALPPPRLYPRERARSVLEGLRLAGMVQAQEDLVWIPGEVRRLELLLWELQYLADFGFRFVQEYTYDRDSHRVVARNRLVAAAASLARARSPVLARTPPPAAQDVLAVYVAHAAWLQAGYLFFGLADASDARAFNALLQPYRVALEDLNVDEPGIGALLRTRTREDATRLLDALRPHLREMPGAWERFRAETPMLTVVKQLPFDAAHFITDHPAKCANLHGGRYELQVKVRDRVDPATGCVLDYGYLKRVVTQRVIERFDHHTLNYAASALAWRSSTEMLAVYVWERLIDCLPALVELQLYETPQSWCCYRGPSLAEHQARGSSPLLGHFDDPGLGRSRLRAQLAPGREELSRAG